MTAVVGILNKTGVAIAADSAVTINSGSKERKIYNTANKIFTLSKYHPVSIMIYNTATFNGIPWEILIKDYRKILKNKSFKTLKEYQYDFIKYLKGHVNLISKSYQKNHIYVFMDFLLSNLLETIVQEDTNALEKIKDEKKRNSLIRKKLKVKVDIFTKQVKANGILEDYRSYTQKNFMDANQKTLSDIYKIYFKKLEIRAKLRNDIYKLIYLIIKTNNLLGSWTGLVFSGYGDQEIFPSCFPMKIGEVFDNRIRFVYEVEDEVTISQEMNSSIKPFAQRDVIDLILSGVDSEIQKIIYDTLSSFLKEFIDKVSLKIEPKDSKFAKTIRKIDVKDLVSNFIGDIHDLQRESHINPLMDAIATLSKEDLSELAESLIYLTYLKRRMSFSEESVGGPVDVAIITKGDGFIWLKRKNYFNPDLNHGFLAKYLLN